MHRDVKPSHLVWMFTIVIPIASYWILGGRLKTTDLDSQDIYIPEGCTIGVAMDNATVDGRPISWKNRDEYEGPVHFIKYITVTGGKYGILGMGYGSSFDLKMGVNDAGLSLQNSLCENMPGTSDYGDFKIYALSQTASITELRQRIIEDTQGIADHWASIPAICAGFSDAHGYATLFELQDIVSSQLAYYEYDPTDVNRLFQFPKQIVARSNTAHLNLDGLDDTSGDTRYTVARDDLLNYANNGNLDIKNWVKYIARHGQPGVDDLPDNNTTRGVMLVHGVNEGENPQIVTAWVGLGNPDYTMVVPVWAVQKTNLSPRVTSNGAASIGWVSDQLYEKNDHQNYDQYINGLFAPVEDNIFEVVDAARHRWLNSGFNVGEAYRIHMEAAETVFAVMNSMNAGTGRFLNVPPYLSALDASIDKLQVSFNITASDVDGNLVAYDWDFGDGSSSTSRSPIHTYSSPGSYLVSARVVDDDGSRNSKWKYITVGSDNQPSTVFINLPLDNAAFDAGTPVSFEGTASDVEDGDLTVNLTWSSDLDGTIGSGGAFSTSDLSVGTHTITASVTDSGNLTGTGQVIIVIKDVQSGGETVEIRVSSGSGDAEECLSTNVVQLNSSDLELTRDDNVGGGSLCSGLQNVGIRFNGVGIPKGATITNAYLQFQVDETSSEATSLVLSGQAADNAATFSSTAGNISSRPRTAATVSWLPPPWTTVGEANLNQRTPKLALVIQEIVNRPGWSSGNSLAILITGSGQRVAESFDGDQSAAPLLHIEYTTGVQNTPTPSPTATPTATPSSTFTPTPTASPLPTSTTTNTFTPTPTPTATQAPPNFPVLVSPEDGAIDVSTSPSLSVSVSDPESNDLTVTFYGRDVSDNSAPGFTLVVLPDTQKYTTNSLGIFDIQTQWIVDQRAAQNIAFVTHVGDLVDDWNVLSQWNAANSAMSKLELPGIPFGISPGNTDEDHYGVPPDTTYFNTYFPESRFAGRPYYGGAYNNDNANSYQLFSASGMDFIVIHLKYNLSYYPDQGQAILNWADALLKTYSNRRAIVVTHYLLNTNDAFSTDGNMIYTELKDNPNLFLMLGGHLDNEGRRMDLGTDGHVIYSLRSDYQTRTNGGNGWLRLMRFSPDVNKIFVTTYSPYLNQFETDADSQFSLDYVMKPPSSFQEIGSVTVPSGSVASVNWPNLTLGKQYEWYVTTNDGTYTTAGPTWSFTTGNEATITPIATPSFTATNTPTATYTLTSTFTPTFTATFTSSPTATATTTSTATATYTLTPTATPTHTSSSIPVATLTPSNTPTSTATPTFTSSPTLTITATNTVTPTYTFTPSNTPTSTATPTFTVSPTNTATSTNTPTATHILTPTYSPVPSNTPTSTASPTNTATSTNTPTATYTATPTFTPSPTITSTFTSTAIATYTLTPITTFTPSNTPTPAPENLAVGKITSVSSYQDSNHTGDMAVDGDTTTYWQPKKAVGKNVLPSEWIVVDLGNTATITGLEIEWDAYYATNYLIRFSDDGTNWTTVFITNFGNGGNDTIQINSISGRYIRVDALNWNDASLRGWLRELEIYGSYSAPQPSNTPTPTPTSNPVVTMTPTSNSGNIVSVHVGDIDGFGQSIGRNWRALVFVLIHDNNHNPLANATVTGIWSDGYSGTGSCITDNTGSCTVTSSKAVDNATYITFTVSDAVYSSWPYMADENHDPDGDNDGSHITIAKP